MATDIFPNRRVVIVDDSRTIQAMLTSALESSPGLCVVGIAADAQTAQTMIADLRPDVVTIDLCMPYIDGAALLEALRDDRHVCKIVISDHAAENISMVAKLQSLGAAACIGKSEIVANPAAFLQKLRAAITTFGKARTFVRPRVLQTGGRAAVDRRVGGRRGASFGAPVPADERARIEYLFRKQLNNATRERQFDLVTSYAAELTSFPVCLLTMIDKDTQWIKSSYGYVGTSMPRAQAFCNYAIAQDDTFIVRNAANDPLFTDNPLVVGDPGIRTYVGHPIITSEGIHVGALCVLDTRVRVVSDGLPTKLKGLAEITAELINALPLAA